MKRFTVPVKIYFNVRVDFEIDCKQIAASISNVLKPDGSIDAQALAEYDDFITNAVMWLEDAGLIIIEETTSKASKTSHYYTLADKLQYESNTMRYIIYLRVSNHVAKNTPEHRAWLRSIRDNSANKLKVKYKVRSIIVNDETFNSYDDALDYVQAKAKEYMKVLNSK